MALFIISIDNLKWNMESTTSADVTNASTLAADAATEHHDETDKFNAAPDCPNSDEDNASNYPIFDRFYDNGSSSVFL